MKTVGEVAMEQGVYSDLMDEIVRDEFYLVMDGEWTVSGSFEAQIFNSMEESAQVAYALSQSVQYAKGIMALSMERYSQVHDYSVM